MKTNKDEILNAALTVFSEKGYEGALLRDISAALKITKSALYKHYESKEALWNTMIDYVEQYYSEHIGCICDIPMPNSWDEFQKLSLGQIDFTLHDEKVKRIRKLLTTEQFRSKRMSELATKHFITDIESLYTKLFVGMTEKGILKCSEPKLLAFEYTAPITVMIHLCDREPDKKTEIMDKIKAHIKKFSQEHKN